MINPFKATAWKNDDRPKKEGWAPGSYLNCCNKCADNFIGDKRAWLCADCAYGERAAAPTT